MIDLYDALIHDLDLTIVREAKRHDGDAFHRLRSVPGIGHVLGLTILNEILNPQSSILSGECGGLSAPRAI